MDLNLRKLSALLIISFSYFVFATYSHARYQEPVPVYENHLSIGPGITYASGTYDGLNGYYTALPTFSFQLGSLFGYNNHDEPLIGLELFQHKRIMFGIAATSGRTYLDLDEINSDREFLYWGIDEDRKRAYELGFIFRYFTRVGLLEIKTFRDIVDTYSGVRSSISWSRPFPDTGNWTITPRAFAKHYGEKFNAYYYDVTEEEGLAARELIENNQVTGPNGERFDADDYEHHSVRPTYSAGNSGHVGFDIQFEYDFTDSLKGVGYIMIEKFSGEIETSPLVEDKQLILGNIGFRYEF
jgi:outer membrane scaffolding protein for murein synthesis (MipA/OmpV family)